MNPAWPREALAILALVVLVALTLGVVVGHSFLSLDDDLLVTDNPKIQALNWPAIKSWVVGYHARLYHPLVLASYALEWRAGGGDPALFHLDNLLLHLVSVVLVHGLARRLGMETIAAAVTAALFGVHPVNVEPVAWISGRKDTLSAPFFLAALAAYLQYLRTDRRRWYGLTLLLFLAALMSKAMTVTLPLALILLDLRLNKLDGKHALDKIPFLLLAALFGMIAINAPFDPSRLTAADGVEWWPRLGWAGYWVQFYLGKLMYPAGLSERYHFTVSDIIPGPVIGAALMVAGMVALLAVGRRRWPRMAWGGAFFLVTLLPVLRIFPFGPTRPADRYLYLPALGLFLVLGEWAHLAIRRWRWPAAMVVVIVIGGLAVVAHQRAKVWRDSVTLFSAELNQYPNEPLVWSDRGLALYRNHEVAAAVADLSRAIALAPDEPEWYFNRGCVQSAADSLAAQADFERALALHPDNPDARLNLGNLLLTARQYREAIVHYTRFIELAPGSPVGYHNRAIGYRALGEMELARADWEKSRALEPDRERKAMTIPLTPAL